ncbi:MAG: REJ domain-containing protein, partial [Phycisphaerales bacterium]
WFSTFADLVVTCLEGMGLDRGELAPIAHDVVSGRFESWVMPDDATSASVAIVNNAPVVATVKATPAIVKNRGDLVTLSTGGIRDVDGRVTSVTYYLDLQNRVPPFGAPPDWPVNSLPAMIVLGTATNASGGWKLAVSTAQFNTGANQIYAVATDNDGATSRFVGAACVVNAAPTIESFTVTPDAGTVAATSFTFAAGGVADANGTVRQVEFFLDVNGNGTLDSRIDKSLGKGRLIDGVWSMTLGPKKLPAGTLTLLARATDNAGGFSAVRTAEVTLT